MSLQQDTASVPSTIGVPPTQDVSVPAAAPMPPQAAPGPARRSWRWMVATVLLLALLGAGGVRWWGAAGTAAVRYTTEAVTRGAVTRTVTATGTVNPVLTIIVGTYVSGVIRELYCDYNTKVTKGQICAKIDPRPYQAVVDQNRANLGVARAQLEKDKAGLAYAELSYRRNATLAERFDVSQDAADNARSLYEQAKAQLAVDQATIAQREAELETAQVNLDYTNIISPVDGTVVSRNVTMGQTVAATFQTPTLFLIATDLTRMEVDTNVSESDIGNVREGTKARFTVDAFPRRVFGGSVVQVRQSPQTVQNVVTFDVVVGVANTDLALKPGMTAATQLIAEQRADVLRVPDPALRYTPSGLTGVETGQPQLWLLRDGRPSAVAVTTGLDDDSFTEIVAGDIKPGDQVIVAEQRGGGGRLPPPRL